jgi:hypothetical protein
MPRLRNLSLLLPLLLAIGCSKSDRAGESAAYDMTPADQAPVPTANSEAGLAAPKNGVAQGTDASGRDVVAMSDTAAATPPTDTTGAPVAAARPVVPQMIIRTGTAVVRVDSLERAMARVEQLAARLGGYIANSSVQTGSSNVRQASLEMKLPAERWGQALGGLKPIGELESQQTGTEDVGEEFVDVTARMANARRLEARLLDLLGTRTGKLDDVLAVERELSRVRQEIERFEGRLRFLRSRVAVSTLTVQLHEPSPVLAPGRSPIVDAFRQAWRNFVGFTAGLIASLGWLVPLGLVVAALVWLLRRIAPRRGPGGGRGFGWGRRSQPAAPPPAPPAASEPPPAPPV